MTLRVGKRFAVAILLLAVPVVAQDTARAASVPPLAMTAAGFARVPFHVGERLEYEVKYGPLRVGSGSMEVAGIDSVRGIPSWHAVFRVRGGTFFYRVDDTFESWMDMRTLSSLRFWKDQNEGRRDVEHHYEIFPERGVYTEPGKEDQPTVASPLDDASIFYFLRTFPLEVGKEYTIDRYFRPDRNPVVIRVLRREKNVEVPAGKFDAIVVQPIFKTPGLFSEGGQAEVWLSDDENHIMLQMKSHVKIIGSLSLYLKSYRPSPTTPPR